MREFKKTNTITYNLMSFTGFKSLMIFTLLTESPKSFEEVCEYFQTHPYINEKISIDTFRVYLTSLKRAGCEIERKRIDGCSKYKIISHPFELRISSDQVKSIVKIYRVILKTSDVKELFVYETFIRALAEKTNNEELAEAINKVSVFKGIDPELVKEVISLAANKRRVTFLYKSPKGSKVNEELVADKIGISNGKVYLYGTNVKYNQYSFFQLSRILEILDVSIADYDMGQVKTTKIRYELKTSDAKYKLSEDEKIVEIKEDSIIVEMESSNKFILKQKVLEYGSLCKVLEPEEFKNDIIDTLKRMREGYN